MDIHQSFSDASNWPARYNRLHTTIDEYANYLQSTSLPTFPRKDTLTCLVNGLRDYSCNCFSFFYDRQVTDRSWERDHVLSRIINQASSDLAAIQLAVEQRSASVSPSSSETHSTLKLADSLAYKALEPALPALRANSKIEGSPFTVITYLRRLPSVRVMPYAQVALIGLPLTTSLDSPVDYLSIPHEVGHFVFWHHPFSDRLFPPVGRESRSPLPALPTSAEYQAEHTIEIFADIYGALVAGPILAESSQIVNARHEQSQFTDEQDETHPAAFLRPPIYTRVLRLASEDSTAFPASAQLKTRIEQLETKWNEYRTEERGVKKATLKDLLLDGMILEIYNQLFPSIKVGWSEQSLDVWSTYRNHGPDDLFQGAANEAVSTVKCKQDEETETVAEAQLATVVSTLKDAVSEVDVPDLPVDEGWNCAFLNDGSEEFAPVPRAESVEIGSYADFVENHFPHRWTSGGGIPWHTIVPA